MYYMYLKSNYVSEKDELVKHVMLHGLVEP